MTGKELIIYILKNDLEDEEVFENGRFKFLIDVEEAAVKFEVGIGTIKLWNTLGFINGFMIGDSLYFPRDIKDPRSTMKEKKGPNNE